MSEPEEEAWAVPSWILDEYKTLLRQEAEWLSCLWVEPERRTRRQRLGDWWFRMRLRLAERIAGGVCLDD